MLLHAFECKVSKIICPGSLEAACLKIESKIRGWEKVAVAIIRKKASTTKKVVQKDSTSLFSSSMEIWNQSSQTKTKLTQFLLKICKTSLRHVEILFWSDNLLPVLFVWNFVELFGVNKANILIYESPTSWWLSRRAQKYGESSSSSWVYVSLLTFKGLIRPSPYLCVQTPKAIDFLCDGLTRVYFWFFRAGLKSAALAFDFSQGWWLGNRFVPNLSRTHRRSR